MDNVQIDDINQQIIKLRTALPIWGVEANDLVELAQNAERAAVSPDARPTTGRRTVGNNHRLHDTLVYWEEQEAPPALRADIRVFRASLDAMRLEVNAAVSKFAL